MGRKFALRPAHPGRTRWGIPVVVVHTAPARPDGAPAQRTE